MFLKTMGLSVLFLGLLQEGSAQNVSGNWGGYFTGTLPCSQEATRIFLHLVQAADSTISGYSTTCFQNAVLTINGRSSGPISYDTSYCSVIGRVTGNAINIRETRFVRERKVMDTTSLQYMTMTITRRGNSLQLKGKWTSNGPDDCDKGKIVLKKMD